MCALVPTVADQFGLSGVWLTIALMGAVQGPLFPTSSVYLSRWMPGKDAPGGDEKAWGTSMLDIGISLGSLLIIPAGHVTCTLLPDGIGLSEGLRWSFTRTINHEAERVVITNSVELMMRGYGVKEEFQKLVDALNSD